MTTVHSSSAMMNLTRTLDSGEFNTFVASFCRSLNFTPPATHTVELIQKAVNLKHLLWLNIADAVDGFMVKNRSNPKAFNSARSEGTSSRLVLVSNNKKRKKDNSKTDTWQGEFVQEDNTLWAQMTSPSVGTVNKTEAMLKAVVRLWSVIFFQKQDNTQSNNLRQCVIEKLTSYDHSTDILSLSDTNMFQATPFVSAMEFLRKAYLPVMIHASMRGTKWVRQAVLASQGSLLAATMEWAQSNEDQNLITELTHLREVWQKVFEASAIRWKITHLSNSARKQLRNNYNPTAYTLLRLCVHLEKLVERGLKLLPVWKTAMPLGLAQLINVAACWRFWTSVITRPGQLATLKVSSVGEQSLFDGCIMMKDDKDQFSLLVAVSKTVKGRCTNFPFNKTASSLFDLHEKHARDVIMKAFGREGSHDGLFLTNHGQSLSNLLDLPADAPTIEIENMRTKGRSRIDVMLGATQAIVEDLLGRKKPEELLGSLTSHNNIRSAFYTNVPGDGQLINMFERGVAHKNNTLGKGKVLNQRLIQREITCFDLPELADKNKFTPAQIEECHTRMGLAAHSSEEAKKTSYDENQLQGSLFIHDRLEAAREYVVHHVDTMMEGETQQYHGHLNDNDLRAKLSLPLRHMGRRNLEKT
jgi:hypothetical protein